MESNKNLFRVRKDLHRVTEQKGSDTGFGVVQVTRVRRFFVEFVTRDGKGRERPGGSLQDPCSFHRVSFLLPLSDDGSAMELDCSLVWISLRSRRSSPSLSHPSRFRSISYTL